MFARRVCGALFGLVLAVPCSAFCARQQDRQDGPQCCTAAIPTNVEPGMLTAEMQALQRRSETFRAQCDRIGAESRVRVRLSVVYSVEGGGRAQTRIRRYRSGALFADVEILFGENYRELLAHEFEHVIEQIDGVDLAQEAAAGRAWEIASGTFETRRALLAGVQVRHEAEMPHAHAPAAAATR